MAHFCLCGLCCVLFSVVDDTCVVFKSQLLCEKTFQNKQNQTQHINHYHSIQNQNQQQNFKTKLIHLNQQIHLPSPPLTKSTTF